MKKKIHYGWIVIFMGLVTTVTAHGFGRMAYTILLPAMKDGLNFDYVQLGLLGTGNFIGYLSMALIGGFLADVSGSFMLPFLVAGIISFIGTIFSLYLKKFTKAG